MELNIKMKINLSIITINQFFSFLLFVNTQKNSYNLMNCTEMKKNLAEKK